LATISSGFVFYNVVTYATDILSLDTPRGWQQFFLVVNACTVVPGVISAIYDSLITLWLNDLPSVAQRAVFARNAASLATVCVVSFRISLVAFMVGFAIYGQVKYNPRKYEPAWVGTLGILVMFAGAVYIVLARRLSTAEQTKSSSLTTQLLNEVDDSDAEGKHVQTSTNGITDDYTVENSGDNYDDLNDDVRSITTATEDATARSESAKVLVEATEVPPPLATRLATQMDLLANRSLFFGGFGYFAISFLFTNRSVVNSYLITMGLSYVSAITLVVWATVVTVELTYCESAREKEAFASRLQPRFYPLVIFIGCVSLAFFFLAFMQIGYVKPITDYTKFVVMILHCLHSTNSAIGMQPLK
jgi:hypothetical protein